MESENLDLDIMQTNAVQLTNKCSVPIPMSEDESFSNNTEEKLQMFHSETRRVGKERISQPLRKIYAEILVVAAVIAVLIEVLNGSDPLFKIHVYFYFYLIGVSILIFLGSFGKTIINKMNGKGLSEECEPGMWMKNNNYLTLSVCFMSGLVASGLASVICTSLGLAAVISSGTCLSSMSSAFTFLNLTFIFLQLVFLFLNANDVSDECSNHTNEENNAAHVKFEEKNENEIPNKPNVVNETVPAIGLEEQVLTRNFPEQNSLVLPIKKKRGRKPGRKRKKMIGPEHLNGALQKITHFNPTLKNPENFPNTVFFNDEDDEIFLRHTSRNLMLSSTLPSLEMPEFLELKDTYDRLFNTNQK